MLQTCGFRPRLHGVCSNITVSTPDIVRFYLSQGSTAHSHTFAGLPCPGAHYEFTLRMIELTIRELVLTTSGEPVVVNQCQLRRLAGCP